MLTWAVKRCCVSFQMSSRWIFFVVSGKKLQKHLFFKPKLTVFRPKSPKESPLPEKRDKNWLRLQLLFKVEPFSGSGEKFRNWEDMLKDKKLQICVSGKDNDLVTSVVKDLIEHLWNMKNFWWLSWKGRKKKTSCEGIYKKFLQITIIFLVIVWWKSL